MQIFISFCHCYCLLVTAFCVLFLIKLRWPKKKNFYDKFALLLFIIHLVSSAAVFWDGALRGIPKKRLRRRLSFTQCPQYKCSQVKPSFLARPLQSLICKHLRGCVKETRKMVVNFPFQERSLIKFKTTIKASDTLTHQPAVYPGPWWGLTRPKQLSMAATARVIWLCESVRYWPDSGLVFECVTCFYCCSTKFARKINF